jgi:hypothetical protein
MAVPDVRTEALSGGEMTNIWSNGFDVYLDESGNTGPDFLQPDQPVYVVAGWMVPRSSTTAARGVIATAAPLQAQQLELKGKNLVTRARGRTIAANVVIGLLSLRCLPVFSLFEKSYAAAGKIVSTFIDPPYNHFVDDGFTRDARSQQACFRYSGLAHFDHREWPTCDRVSRYHAA